MNVKGIAVLLLCIVLVAATGCLSSGGHTDTPASAPQVMYTSDSSGRVQSVAKVSEAYSGNPVPVPGQGAMQGSTGISTDIETKIIKTAYLTVEVPDVTGSLESLKTLAISKGGYLSSSSIDRNYNNQLTGNVVLRVPQAEFESTLAGVKALGTVKSASTQGEDVTEQYVDLQAQKTSYQNQLAQYNAIMKQSTRVEDIIKVQEQIDRVQTELDRLEGRLNYLNSRIDFSTITVNLQEPTPVGGDTGHSFISTLNEGIAGFIGMIDALIIIFFTILPLIILGGIGYGIYHWYKGRKGQTAADDDKEKKG